MNCKNCGNPLNENVQFCENCGAPVNNVSAQTNYGQAPKNSTWQLILIFIGSALLTAAIILIITQLIGGKKNSNNTIVSGEKIVVDEKDDDEVVAKPTTNTKKSTYTVKSGNFVFKIPTNLVYQTEEYVDGVDTITVGDQEDTWLAFISTQPGVSYDKLLKNKNQLQQVLANQQGFTKVSDAVEKSIGGVPFIISETILGGQNTIIAYTKADDTTVFTISIVNAYDEFDYDALEIIAEIVNNVEVNAKTTNMEVTKKVDLNAITKLGQ